MALPEIGDLLVRGPGLEGFELIEMTTSSVLATGLPSARAALPLARARGGFLWQQFVDRHGQPLGAPFRLLPIAEP